MGYEKSTRSVAHIIEAASTVLARQGYAKTSLMDIAREAGMSKGAVHYHFPTKESLIGQVLQKALKQVQERTLSAWAEGEDSTGSTRSSLEELWRLRAKRTDEALIVADLLVQSLHDEQLRPQMASFYAEAADQMRSHLEQLQTTLGVRFKVPLEFLPRLILAVLDGLSMQSYVDESSLQGEQVVDAIETLLFSLVQFPEAQA
jgi:AcrR family transcriptional regulator